MTTTIRPARPADAAAIERLIDRAYEGYVPLIGRKPAPMLADYPALIREGSVTLLDDVGDLLGLIVLKQQPDHLLIDNVAVDPDHQGRGFGRLLMDFAQGEARRLGLAELRLVTNQVMVRNIALYRHLGFTEYGRGHEDGYDRIFMRKIPA